MDRMSKGCMESGPAVLNELRIARTCSRTRGFRSHVLTTDKMQEAARSNGEYSEAMLRIADREKKKSDRRGKYEEITSESLKIRDEGDRKETGRQHKGKCVGCQKKGHDC